jgi:hypothetical protein
MAPVLLLIDETSYAALSLTAMFDFSRNFSSDVTKQTSFRSMHFQATTL